MTIYRRLFPAGILVLPNQEYFFGAFEDEATWLKVAADFQYGIEARIFITNFGAIGIDFLPDGSLASIEKVEFGGSGLVPEEVTTNHDALRDLQTARVAFANFIAGALFGRLMARKHTALTGARLVGLDTVLTFQEKSGALRIENSSYTEQIFGPKAAMARARDTSLRRVSTEELSDAVAFVSGLAARATCFQYANLRTCIAMNYQGAILHNAQNATASLALNFAVAEAQMKEIFCAYGLAPGYSAQPFATTPHKMEAITKRQFADLKAAGATIALVKGGLLNPYLGERLHEARKSRNGLMHEAIPANLVQSGNMQTAIRDLWALLIDGPFELNAGFSMRI